MLPKKRKFDLSKFDLETSSPGPSRNSNASAAGAARSSSEASPSPVSIAPVPAGAGLPSASLFQIRSGGSDATISLPIFAAKGLPASGFLTPETVHEAFAGNFLRTSTPSSISNSPLGGKPPISSPTVGVDLTQRPPPSHPTVTFSTVGHEGSAFSRPPSGGPHHPRSFPYAGDPRGRGRGSSSRPALVAQKREVRGVAPPEYKQTERSTPVSSYSPSSTFRSSSRDPTVAVTSTNVGYYMDQGKVIAVSNPDYNVERTEVISSGKQAIVSQEYVGLNLTKPSGPTYSDSGARSGARRVELDLSEWVGHRVLALRGEFYFPGVIQDILRTSETGRDVSVLFDGDSDPLTYKNVLDSREKPPIISDAIPLTNQVSMGSKLCVKLESPRTMYAEALVYEVSRQPLQFLVKFPGNSNSSSSSGTGGGEGGEKQWVRRAQLRLTAPPWQEELANAQEMPTGPIHPLPGPSHHQDQGGTNLL